ncbi:MULTISPECIES: MarR family winged helix-turn-helix transcriptional regulator [unclassified Nocardioides]|jgi:DNA-binding MarR family transcriptional regulator|uniref:MarR family winged helix-turn-helix transcriptional regulator n=1 Tax=unclassified Nocardioides TaxID=2615069 RepID=UPI000702AB9C|nr:MULTISPECIES: MarR family transcriptional regulator [unclassified Nocardioides]KRC54863.1 MarR family transcriptional regulator [Nocardioides sp. Root79]KRC73793.1 MarR family transcriptional regulator [Nocardioides sp. Root240]
MSTAEPRWLDQEQQRAWRSFLLGTTLLLDRIDEDLRRDHGLSAVEYEILVRLSEAEGRMRMAQLAASLAHSRSRVTHTVKRMENAGLVERTGSPEDGRGVVCRLTDKGSATLRTAAPSHVETVRQSLIDLVDPCDLQALDRVMNAVCDQLIADHPERELR